jgi:hypothetical protein
MGMEKSIAVNILTGLALLLVPALVTYIEIVISIASYAVFPQDHLTAPGTNRLRR